MENLQNQMQGLNVHQPAGRPPRHKRPAHAYHQDLNQAPLAQVESSHGFDPRLVPSQAPQPSTGYVRADVAAKQIPSLPELREADQALWRTVPFCTWDNRTSYPSSQTDYTCIDQGNSSPKFARLTLPLVPATAETLEKTELPLALVLQPLAEQRPEEMPIPVIDFGPEGPPRCTNCMSYISPFHSFGSGGGQFHCPMCGSATQTRQSYYSPVDNGGRRVDIDSRPELKYGTVDFVVPREYWAKEQDPKPIHWIIAIDVSSESVKKGIPEAAADAVRSALYGEKGGLAQGAQVSIITFDRTVHFYNLKVFSWSAFTNT
jgi:protein transport protein SEC24